MGKKDDEKAQIAAPLPMPVPIAPAITDYVLPGPPFNTMTGKFCAPGVIPDNHEHIAKGHAQ